MLAKWKQVLRRYRLCHKILHAIRWMTSPGYRNVHHDRMRSIMQWRNENGGVLEECLGDGSAGTAVLSGWSRLEHVVSETVVRKALEKANFQIEVLSDPTPLTVASYAAVGVEEVRSFERFCPVPDYAEARTILSRIKGPDELLDFRMDGATVGKYVASTSMRQIRRGTIDPRDPEIRQRLVVNLAKSLAAVRGAQNLIRELQPTAVTLVDRGYTPYGEFFDIAIDAGIQVITWNIAHRNNTIMLKRYDAGNRLEHPSSLSNASWDHLLTMPWDDEREKQIHGELEECYRRAEWYGEVGTQVGKKHGKREHLVKKFDLDPRKKTAVIYSHIFWDATFFWGEDLFQDYHEWFVESVRVACQNDNLNWLVKVHPANIVKNARDGVIGSPGEILALREHFDSLPDHVQVVPADTEINTLSLISNTEYCLTVRGTVGIEAAMKGNRVLTAGTGRYDCHGFTLDFDSKQDYLTTLANLQAVPEPDSVEKERAARFAYGVFLCRPVTLTAFDFRFNQDRTASLSADLLARSAGEIAVAPEIVQIADWLKGSDEDFLVCPQRMRS